MSKNVSVGVGSIVLKGQSVLLIRRHQSHGDGQWSTPGGYLEYGESFEECARRETEEETGVLSGNFAFLALTNDVFPADSLHFATIWMLGQWISGEPSVCAASEITCASWYPTTSLPKNLFTPFRKIVRKSQFFIGNQTQLSTLFCT